MRLIDADALIEANKAIIDCEIDHPKYQNTVREIIDSAPTIEPKQADDLISRADAIEAIARLHALNDEKEIRRAYNANPHSTMTDFEDTLVSAFDAIYDIPSAQPKCGEWRKTYVDGVWKCSECNAYWGSDHDEYEVLKDFTYCPNCGARMTERSE